jgi:hypothetical protein
MIRRVVRFIPAVLLATLVLAGVAWAILALWFDGPSSRLLAGFLCVTVGLTSVLLAILVRPFLRGLLAASLLVILIALWWSSLAPSNFRDWSPDVARTAQATFRDSFVTIHNVRNFKYRSETAYDQLWETRVYDLDHIRGVDLFMSFWGPTQIAHTIVSWDFGDRPDGDSQHLAISIETRKQRGQSYSAVRGFFRQFELYYVVADERDLIGLRTNHRGEQVYLYQIRATTEQARALLMDYLNEVNHLAEHPEWYNALTHNCTTSIRGHALNVGVGGPLDFRLLANGHLDELLYERGQIDTRVPFAELRASSNITERAKAAGDSADFSDRIRQGLPQARGSEAENASGLFAGLHEATIEHFH